MSQIRKGSPAPPTKRARLLSKELLVAREIYAATVVENDRPVYFNKLVKRMGKKRLASRATVSLALDVLFDQGMVRAEWGKTESGKHVRDLQIAGEAVKFVKTIYDETT